MALCLRTESDKDRINNIIRGHINTHVVANDDNGVIIDGYISFDSMEEIVRILSTTSPNKELFEECWIAYRRKGSKKKSLDYWRKLTDNERAKVLPHIKFYVTSRERQFQRDFERYLRDKVFNDIVSNGNDVVFDPQVQESGAYRPSGRTIWYNEERKCYMSSDNFYYGVIDDGYACENRPDGATIVLNNARGTVTWNASEKKWIRYV
jgi:hypothetical protein